MSCRAELEQLLGDSLTCDVCRREMIDLQPACRRCGAYAGSATAFADKCPECPGHDWKLSTVVRLGRYDGLLRSLVLRMKSTSEQPLALALGNLLAQERSDELQQINADAVVPIPMHWSRRVWRGVNSPELVAERLATHLKIPLAAHLLRRCRRTEPQAELSPPERRQNVRGAFRAGHHPDLSGARILLVDDILTTGATSNEAARILHHAGAVAVSVAVLARAMKE